MFTRVVILLNIAERLCFKRLVFSYMKSSKMKKFMSSSAHPVVDLMASERALHECDVYFYREIRESAARQTQTCLC